MPPTFLTKFFGRTVGEAAGFAMGSSTSRTLDPLLQDLTNNRWAAHRARPLDPEVAALADLEGFWTEADAIEEAGQTGINEARYKALRRISDEGIELSLAFQAWRRNQLTDAEFTAALRKARIEERWWAPIRALKNARLTPAQIALGIVRSLLNDPGFLPVSLDVTDGKVPSYGVSPIDPLVEAEAAGVTAERLRVMVGEIGLPMGLQAAASAVFRNIIERADFNRAVLEGDTRPEWADAIFEQSRQIPTARDFFENALRGYHDFDWALDQAKRHGMSEADATVIYQNQGRPMNIRQITQALSRGGKFNPEPGELKDPYRASIVEGNVKPAYYDLALSLKYTLPSPFVMRQLTASGVWNEAKAAQRLKDSGWLPADADEAAKAWAAGTGATADPHIKKAQTQLWNAVHSAYMAGDASDATVTAKLPQAGVSAVAVAEVLATWKHEREVIRQRITPAQLKKAWQKAVTNPVTGAPWTKDEVLAELLSRGWNTQDANTFLET